SSPLRPHCHARDRLRLWRPIQSQSQRDPEKNLVRTLVSDEDLDRILAVMSAGWAPSTRECYGSGLLVYHVFCDNRDVEEQDRCPADMVLILSFISACTGLYSGGTLTNYVYAVRAWHVLHLQEWSIGKAQLDAMLAGAATLAPPTSKRQKRNPVTVEFIVQIRNMLNLDDPLDSAVFACLTTTFFTIARLGEFTVPTLTKFTLANVIQRRHIRTENDRHGLEVTVFALPKTKASATGEDVYWAKHQGLEDPSFALQNHFRINNPNPDSPLFSWKHP
ncbi:hypothetical protein SISSUDRAFT_959187, partial [Sistotremastrum suecicum HHB10207 ss-3]